MKRWAPPLLALSLLPVWPAQAQAPRPVQIVSTDCRGEWSAERFLDALRIELHPFAELRESAALLLRLAGGCEERVRITLEGDATMERVVDLHDIPQQARERAVAMAMALLVESIVRAPETVDALVGEEDNTDALPGMGPGAAALDPPPPGASMEHEVAAGGESPVPVDPLGEVPPSPNSASNNSSEGFDEDAPRGETTSARPPSRFASHHVGRHVEGTFSLGWLPDGGASLGVDVSLARPLAGPLYFAGGATFLRGTVEHPIGSLSFHRLEAHAGLGLARYFGAFGLEGRVLARVGWAYMGADSATEPVVRSDSALSIAFQLDAGVLVRLPRVSFVLRGGPLLVTRGLVAEHPLYTFIRFSGPAISASAGLRVPF